MHIEMNYSDKDLINEIDKEILKQQINGDDLPADWIVQAVCANHPTDDDHATLCQYKYTRAIVGKRMAKAIEKSARMANDEQMSFMGHAFDHIQESYVINRNDEDVMVSLANMSPAELRAKADILRKEAIAKSEHADELEQVANLIEQSKTG